jgi:hypothetical protein
VQLNGANLNISFGDGFTPSVGQKFTIINNDGVDPIQGTFNGIPQNGFKTIDGVKYQVSYTGGDGNDVVLTVVEIGGGTQPAEVVNRQIFYNQSAWDGNNAAIDPANDNLAIATDKVAYLPGAGIAQPTHATNFTRGINGIIVDIQDAANPAGISVSDFTFKVGNNNAPNTWAAAPAPTAISVVPGGGLNGSDRVYITFASGSITNRWLEVQVLATANTGLTTPDVHFWGNKVADSFTGSPADRFETTPTDSLQIFANAGSNKPITDPRDYNRDKSVLPNDSLSVFANAGSIVRINIPVGGPFAAPAAAAEDDGGSAVASALAASAAPQAAVKVPSWISSRLASVDLNSGPMAKLFTNLAQSNTAVSRSLLLAANEVTDALDLDDSLLESLIAGLN